MKQSLGLIKWFDNEKGFGRIGTVDGTDIFISINQFTNRPSKVLNAKAIFFEIQEDKKGKKAVNVSDPETYDHFHYIMSLEESNPKVSIEFTIKRKSRWGNEYIRKEFRDSSIFNYAIYQLLRNKDSEEVKHFFVKNYEESHLDTAESIKKRFQTTREIIEKISFKTIKIDNEGNEIVKEVSSFEIINNIFTGYLLKTDEEYLFEIWCQNDHYRKQSNYLFNKIYEEKFSFPEKIFLDNYKKIDRNLIHKLLLDKQREDICSNIISKKIEDYNEIVETTYIDIKLCINELLQTESYSTLNESLFKKNIDIFFKEKSKWKESDYFNTFLNFLSRNSVGNQKKHAIDVINQNLDDDTIFKYWQEFKYFSPSKDFLNKHLEKLTHHDFINAPSEFHNEYFLNEYNKLNFDNSLLSFCNLLFLVLEIPDSQVQNVEDELNEKFTTAFWLYNSYYSNDNYNNYSKVHFNFDVTFSKENVKEYLNKVDNLNEIIYLIKIINEICIIYTNHKPNSSNLTTFLRFSQEDKIRTVDELLKTSKYSLDIRTIDILKIILTHYDNEEKLKITADFIPKFIDPNDDNNFKELINSEDFFKNDSKNRNSYFKCLSELVTVPKKITLWCNDYTNEIEINTAIEFLKECPDNIQFNTLKKIFSSIHLNKKLITTELYRHFEDLANSTTLNLNVRIALYVLNTLNAKNQFINDKTIFELVSQRLNENVNELVKIDELLDKCTGRTWKTHSYDGGGKDKWFVNIGGHEFAVEDSSINIDGKNYYLNKDSKSININGIYYNFKWSKKTNIFHTKNYGIPDGLTFCDAFKSQLDTDLNLNFYWCCNSKCYSPCQKDYNPFQWKKYTLRDFIKILGIAFDNDLYYRFAAVINRVNRLLEKLKCNGCNKLMRDATTSEFAFYRVNTFHCTDSNCNEFHKTVYLTHCLNWRCLNIIDTRVSKACSNGWYICDKCDNCCSQEKIDARYQNLLTNAAFNPKNPRHQKLKFQVDNKLGHLERNEVYNYKTGEKK